MNIAKALNTAMQTVLTNDQQIIFPHKEPENLTYTKVRTSTIKKFYTLNSGTDRD